MTKGSSPATDGGPSTLSGILRVFENARGNLTLAEMARQLGIERSALDGMIQLLVRKGRLREVREQSEACPTCNLRLACGAGRSTGPPGICYELVETGPEPR